MYRIFPNTGLSFQPWNAQKCDNQISVSRDQTQKQQGSNSKTNFSWLLLESSIRKQVFVFSEDELLKDNKKNMQENNHSDLIGKSSDKPGRERHRLTTCSRRIH